MTTLSDALTRIADYAHLDASALIAFADDHESGRGAGEYDAWSIDADEGKVLYALVRALQPAQAIEIGVRHGASTAHLLAALTANGDGKLDSYDLEPNGTREAANWTFHQADALTVDFPAAEFVFEDSAHGLDYSLKLFERLKALARVVVTHDYAMTPAHGDFYVKPAFDTIFPDGMAITTLDGCERGMALWVNPILYLDANMPLQQEEIQGLIGGGELHVTAEGDAKLKRAHAPDKITRKPAAKKAAPTKRTAKR